MGEKLTKTQLRNLERLGGVNPADQSFSRRQFLAQVADSSTLVLPIHFPNPTVGRIAADGADRIGGRCRRRPLPRCLLQRVVHHRLAGPPELLDSGGQRQSVQPVLVPLCSG